MAQQTAFGLSVGPHGSDTVVVTRFAGTEALSRPFELHVDFFPKDDAPLDAKELVGAKASLEIQAKGGGRHVHGIVHRVEALGEIGGKHRYRLRVAPAFERLKHVRNSRIFQEQSTPEIVKAILGEGNVEHRVALQGSYPPREYCVQYRESDFDFISRLLEWEGIFYFFEHSADGHVLVLADTPSAHAELPGGGTLPFRERDSRVADEEHVHALELSHRIRSGAVMVRDFDFKKPALDLTASSKQSSGGFTALERYDYPAGYVAPGDGKRAGKVRLEEQQQDEKTYSGGSATPRLCAGFTFEVEESDTGVLHGKFLAVEVRHSGSRPEVHGHLEALGQSLYRNEFRCLPKGVPFRPHRVTHKPVVSGVQTATVTGPGGAEIHPDKHGRIKVQFHWDREGKRDDRSSCWMRVGQVWGGPAWGGLFLPRIGQEVVVRFLEGDPDCPLITGAVYNGKNPTPYALPDEKTKSTLKSDSSPGSGGFNEFRFEDAAGSEEIFTHASKDKLIITENDKTQRVGNDETLLVVKDRKKTVEGNQKLAVHLDDLSLVEQNQSLKVVKNRTTDSRANHDESIDGNQSVTVGGNRHVSVANYVTTSVGLAAALDIGAVYLGSVALAYTESVGAAKTEEVVGARMEYVVGSRTEQVDKDRAAKIGGDLNTEIKGQLTYIVGKDWKDEVGAKQEQGVKEAAAWLAKTFELKADKFTLIVGGNKIFDIEKSGNVKWFGKAMTFDGSDIKVKGAKIKLDPAGSLASKELKLKKIKELQEEKLKHSVHAEFSGADPTAFAGQSFEIKMADGTKKSGAMGGSGNATVSEDKPGGATLSFPKLADGAKKKS